MRLEHFDVRFIPRFGIKKAKHFCFLALLRGESRSRQLENWIGDLEIGVRLKRLE
jgi:hypothetical protein